MIGVKHVQIKNVRTGKEKRRRRTVERCREEKAQKREGRDIEKGRTNGDKG